LGLGKESEQTPHERAAKTLIAIKELKHYLEGVEKDLSRMSKKFSDKEIAHGVGFAGTGIHEALSYLDIVRKVIEKTERIVAKNDIMSGSDPKGLCERHPDGRTNLSSAA
jgi:predicted RNase H-like nuclease (RuvC/YqgF family)